MIVFVGFMGSGKSSVGQSLATRLGSAWADSDHDLTAAYGAPAGKLLTSLGEEEFRRREAAVIARALTAAQARPDDVYSLGGGAVTTPQVRDVLASHVVVFLRVALRDVLSRPHLAASRPLLRRPDVAEIFERRQPLYETVADITVDTHGASVSQIAEDLAKQPIIAALRRDA